jgi:hypothetical protein
MNFPPGVAGLFDNQRLNILGHGHIMVLVAITSL